LGNAVVRAALESMMRATEDDATPLIRRLARIQTRAALKGLDGVPATSGEGEKLREAVSTALATHDKAISVCPDSKLDANKDCPKCGAASNEGCRITALADAAFVHNARAALATPGAAPIGSDDADYSGYVDAGDAK